ncbi:hypothetical protein [Novosphingobium chloroacetimidivorans]
MSLADARIGRDEAKKLVANGIDPALETTLSRMVAKPVAAKTFQAATKA